MSYIRKNPVACLVVLIAACLIFTSTASATFKHCFNPIQPYVEFQNNCDGTVTADYYYDNPNEEFCFFDFYRWRWVCKPCPDIWLPIGPLNKQTPAPYDQGQTKRFKYGKHYSHSVTFPANGVKRTWSVKYPLIARKRRATANPEKADQNCPIQPKVDCIEAIPDQGYKAHFTVTNYNTRDAYIPAGNGPEGINRFTDGIGGNQGQPEKFPSWPEQVNYSLMWDGSATQWRLGLDGEVISRAPETDHLDLAYFDVRANRCENVPVNPFVTCTYDNQDGTVTAHYGYESFRPGITEIPVDTQQGGANELGPIVPSLVVDDQPSMFMLGRYDGVFNVTWDTSETQSLFWWLFYGEPNFQDGAEAYAPDGDISRPCAQVTPVACIQQTMDGNENGYLTARFGYANDNNFDIDVDLGPLNEVVGGNTSPDPSIPTMFLAGGNEPDEDDADFSVEFDDDDAVSWTITGVTETADINTALCEPNELPTCNIVGQTGLDCGGDTTGTTLTAEGVDPEGRDVSFEWTITCGEEGDTFTQTVSGDNGETLDITLTNPANGLEVAAGTCTVELSVSDDFGASTCSAELTSTACDLDCEDLPYMQGTEPRNTRDVCGVCRPQGDPNVNSTCLDCAGVPNGAAVLDTTGTCCFANEFDSCGICNGDNTSCLDCTVTDNSETVVELESVADEFLITARRGLRQVRRKAKEVGRRIPRRFIRATRTAAESLAAQAALAATNIPVTTQSCGNRDLCVSVSNDGEVTAYTDIATQFHDLIDSIAARLRRILGGNRTGTRLVALADAYLEDAFDSASNVPTTTDSCNQ